MSPPQATNPVTKRWSPEQIRSARQTPLYPVLHQLGHRLHHVGEGNYEVTDAPVRVIIKANYWTSPDTGRSGNAIDYLVHLEHMRFEEAMKVLLALGDQSRHTET
jgi:hypothetical protein